MIINTNSHNQIEWTEDFNPFDLTFDENLEEDIEKHEILNPKLWNDDATLKAEVQEKIQTIVQYFLNQLQEDGIKINIKDIILVGSNCSYNYTKDSDLDIHIIADTSSLKCPDNLYPLLYSAYRSLFNGKYNISFYGIPVEIYVEVEDSPRISNGCYSVLNQKWITEPVKADIPDIDMDEFYTQFEEWENKYNNLLKGTTSRAETIELINQLIEQIYELRKNGLAKDGEYGIDNLIFKEFRNRGYLDKLKELKNELIGQEFSLESLEEQYKQAFEQAKKEIQLELSTLEEGVNKYKEAAIKKINDFYSEDTSYTKIEKNKWDPAQYKQRGFTIQKSNWPAIWHHKDGNHGNNKFTNFLIIRDNKSDFATFASIAHKLIHIYAQLVSLQIPEPILNQFQAQLDNLSAEKDITYYAFSADTPAEANVIKYNNFSAVWNDSMKVAASSLVNDKANQALQDEVSRDTVEKASESLILEDTIKVKDHKWTNKGKHGTHGFFNTKEAADAQRKAIFALGWHENLEEEFNKEMLSTYAKEIQEATNYFPIMQENGIFEIYNLPENTVNLILSQINNLDFVEWVQKAVTNFNVSADTLMNVPSRKYKIYGQIKI